jgi:hypothetical protein
MRLLLLTLVTTASCSAGGQSSGSGVKPSDAGEAASGDDATSESSGHVDGPAAESSTEQAAPQTGLLCPTSAPRGACAMGEFCCVSDDLDAGPQIDTCVPDGGACSGTPVSCARTVDCSASGLACCGLLGTSGGQVDYQWVRCVSPIVWGCDGMNTIRFCDPMENDCPSSQPRCIPSQVLIGYYGCHT